MTGGRASAQARRATVAEWLDEPEERGAELIGGRIVYKALPRPEHGVAQGTLYALLRPYHRRPGDAGKPGGWWLSLEVELELVGEGVRPDLLGWRRDRVPALPVPGPSGAVTEPPDWIGEVLSRSTAARDLGDKLDLYHRAQVRHYWIVDPYNETLTVFRWTQEGYVAVLGAGRDRTVRAEPFEAVELRLGELFGEGEEEEPGGSGG